MLKTYPTTDLYDKYTENLTVLDYGLKSYGGKKEYAGVIATVKCFEDNSKVKELLNTKGNGRVLVVDGGGSCHCALLGDMIATSAAKNDWAGILIYGCIRDVAALTKLSIGIHAIGHIPRKSVRKGIGKVGVTVQVFGAQIKVGDYLYADEDGVVVSANELNI